MIEETDLDTQNDDVSQWIDMIPPEKFSPAVKILRAFCEDQGFLEVPTQHLLRAPLRNLEE